MQAVFNYIIFMCNALVSFIIRCSSWALYVLLIWYTTFCSLIHVIFLRQINWWWWWWWWWWSDIEAITCNCLNDVNLTYFLTNAAGFELSLQFVVCLVLIQMFTLVDWFFAYSTEQTVQLQHQRLWQLPLWFLMLPCQSAQLYPFSVNSATVLSTEVWFLVCRQLFKQLLSHAQVHWSGTVSVMESLHLHWMALLLICYLVLRQACQCLLAQIITE